jgi:TonB family protein
MRLVAQIALLLAAAIGSNVGAPAQQAESTARHSDASEGSAPLVNLSPPIYPPQAHQANIYGEVHVAVMVFPNGKTDVTVESGHPMLKQAALDSAKQSRFECRQCDAAVSYELVYSFRVIQGSDCCSAISVPARVALEPQPSDATGQRQIHINITTEEICLCDPAVQLTKKNRSLKCLYLWKCSQS